MTMIVCLPLNVWFCKSTEITTWYGVHVLVTSLPIPPQSFQHTYTCVYIVTWYMYMSLGTRFNVIVLTTEVRQRVYVHTHMYIVIMYL